MRRIVLLVVIAGIASVLSARAVAIGGYTFVAIAGAGANPTMDGNYASAQFGSPAGLAQDAAGNVYVADAGSHTIRKISLARDVTTLAGLAGTSGTADGVGAAARFNVPHAVAVDATGTVYVADTGNSLVRKIAPDGTVTTIGSAAQLTNPWGIAIDGALNVYVADTGDHTIVKIAPDNAVTTLAGARGVSGSADGNGAAARFNRPQGLAIDSAGNLYVADTGNYTIRCISPSGDVTTFAGVAGDPGPPTPVPFARLVGVTDGARGIGRFFEPVDVAVDGNARLLVVSRTEVLSNISLPGLLTNRLRAVAMDGTVSTVTAAGPEFFNAVPVSGGRVLLSGYGVSSVVVAGADGVVSPYAGRGTGCTAFYPTDGTRFEARFCSPGRMARDGAGTLYVADGYAIRKITSDGVVSTLAGDVMTPGSADGVGTAARFGAGPPELPYPLGLAVSANGTLYVADPANHAVRLVTSGGTVTTIVGALGVPGSADGPGTTARLRYPQGVAVDPSGVLWIADSANEVIRRLAVDGTVSTLAGLSGTPGSADGAGSAARFDAPIALAVLASGALLVTDENNDTIRLVQQDGTVTTFAGRAGVKGSSDGTGSGALFTFPNSVAVDGAGNAYVGEGEFLTHLRMITPGAVVTTISTSILRIGAVDASGNVYAGSNGNIWLGTTNATAAPSITTNPSNQTVAVGSSPTFSVTASAVPDPGYQWQLSADSGSTWANLSDSLSYSGTTQATLTVIKPTVAAPARRFRCVVTNYLGSAISTAATLTVNGLSLTPAALRFSSARVPGTGAITGTTPPQPVTIAYSGVGAPSFTAQGDQPWLSVAMASGGAPGFTVSINNIAQSSSAVRTGTVTVTASTGPTATLPVSWTTLDGGTTSAPFGQVDTPVQGATGVQGAISVSGWVVDDVGIQSVKIYRNCLAAEPVANCQSQPATLPPVAYVGDATLVPGARPDIDAAFPQYPVANRAGWGYLLLTNMLPRTAGTYAGYGGQGPITLYVVATDLDGHQVALGRAWTGDQTPTSITMDNDHILKPFGAIDTPSQGGTVFGISPNFGWVLTPDSNTTADSTDILMPTDGSTMRVFIDGVAVGTVAYNQCRGNVGNPVPAGLYCNDDVANIFGNPTPQPTFTTRTANATLFRNLDAGRAAIGSFDVNTTTLANGMHSLAWGVTDSAGRTEGIGSRNFWVLNAGADAPVARDTTSLEADVRALALAPAQSRGDAASLPPGVATSARVMGRVGFDLTAPLEDVAADADGSRRVQIPDVGRVELNLDGAVDAGYLVVGDTLRDLPIGSHLDLATGTFAWAPAPGYLGTYHLVFVRGSEQIPIDVTIRPIVPAGAGESEIRMNVDLPLDGSSVHGPVTIAGWALDPQAWTESGIGAIHVWAYRRDAPSTGPQFLGAADLHAARPDVASAFGAEFDRAGFGLITTALTPGEYDLVVYAWCARTGRWEDARTVRVNIR